MTYLTKLTNDTHIKIVIKIIIKENNIAWMECVSVSWVGTCFCYCKKNKDMIRYWHIYVKGKYFMGVNF